MGEHDEQFEYKQEPQHGGHYKSGSMVIHDSMLEDINNDEMHSDFLKYKEEEEINESIRDSIESDHDSIDNALPFNDIDIVDKDLSWLDTNELVPISQKDMLDANDTSRLRVNDVPDLDVIRSDGLEQRERQNAVDKLEKSYMADAALKKAKEKEKEAMQKRLDEQKQAQLNAELKEQQKEFDILKQGGVIRQKKTAEE